MLKGPAGRSRIWPSSHLTALEPSCLYSALTPVCPGLLSLSHGARVRIPWTLSAPPLARPGPEGSMQPISPACSVVYIKCVLISMAGQPSILAFQVTSRVGSRKREFKSCLCPRNYPSLSLMQRVLLSFSRGCGETSRRKCLINAGQTERTQKTVAGPCLPSRHAFAHIHTCPFYRLRNEGSQKSGFHPAHKANESRRRAAAGSQENSKIWRSVWRARPAMSCAVTAQNPSSHSTLAWGF